MKCEICNKNDATIHIQEIMNGVKKHLNICPECAAKKELLEADFKGFNLAEILYNLSSHVMSSSGKQQAPQQLHASPPSPELKHPIVTCKRCGWNSVRFRETGRLGCAKCYKVFEPVLAIAIKNMHKGTMHIGKRPGSAKDTNVKATLKLLDLQKKLEKHVKHEEYEEAAKVRDEIKNLKKSLAEGNKKK
ncbi:MAG: UvrB/UvrC motif-containing protein [Victivallales bacterium]|nr:UvrB/UvrC motif-containing protein [Victivallales bacterium]